MQGKELLSNIGNMSVTLLGAGVSNTPLVRFLAERGARVSVRDKKTDLGDRAEAFTEAGATLILGEGYLDDITEDVIFRSPGFRPDTPQIADATARGAILTSEIKLFLECCPCPVYAVTGSDGKSTTTTVTSLMLAKAFEGTKRTAFLGGNIGEPLLHRIDAIKPDDAVAVELSSFQLMDADAPAEAAIITNVTPNHLNWHTGMDEYIEAKSRILRRAKRAVLNYGNDVTRRLGEGLSIPVTYFSRNPIPLEKLADKDSATFIEDGAIVRYGAAIGGKRERTEIMRVADIVLPGLHNAENYMAAASAVWNAASSADVRAVASTFGGVRHRLQLVAEKDGVRFYNSSIDSSPTRTAAALDALSGRSLVVICGGYDKNIPYEPLADEIFAHPGVRVVVTNGQTGPKIAALLRAHPKFAESTLTLVEEVKFDDAVRRAASLARPGDSVLLSPASASFDQFENFEKRGERFTELVNELSASAS